MAFWNKKLKAETVLENQLQSQPKAEITPTYKGDTKSLPIALKDKLTAALANYTGEKGISVLSMLANAEEISQEVIQFINKETTYIARIPKKLNDDVKNGLLDFMCDKKTGEKLSVLVDGKHKSRGYMRIDEINRVELASSLANIAMQQQLAHMTEIINDVRAKVISLQEAHDTDLFGSIKGMRDQLLQMRDATDPDTKKQLSINAITELNKVRGILEETIIKTLRELDDIPNTDRAILYKIAKDKNFLTDTVEKYNRIEELFGYYITATQLLGYAYAFLDEPRSYEDIFMPSIDIIENEHLQKLVSAENLFNENVGEAWYKNPENYLLKIKNTSQTVFLDSSDFVEIEVSGEKLLEVIEHGSRPSETHGKIEVSDS